MKQTLITLQIQLACCLLKYMITLPTSRASHIQMYQDLFQIPTFADAMSNLLSPISLLIHNIYTKKFFAETLVTVVD